MSKHGYLRLAYQKDSKINPDWYAPLITWGAGMKASDWLVHNSEMLMRSPFTADVSYLVKRFGLATAQDALRMNTGKWVVIRKADILGEVWIAEVKEQLRPEGY